MLAGEREGTGSASNSGVEMCESDAVGDVSLPGCELGSNLQNVSSLSCLSSSSLSSSVSRSIVSKSTSDQVHKKEKCQPSPALKLEDSPEKTNVPSSSADHVLCQEGRSGGGTSAVGRNRPSFMDQVDDRDPTGGGVPVSWPDSPSEEQQDRVPQDGDPAEQGQQEEGHAAEVHDNGSRHVDLLQRDHSTVAKGCSQENPDGDRTRWPGSCGLRGVQQPVVQRPGPSTASIRSVGMPHCQGRTVRLPSCPSGEMAGTIGQSGDHQRHDAKVVHHHGPQGGEEEPGICATGCPEACPGFERIRGRFQQECNQLPVGGDQPDADAVDVNDGHPQGRGGGAERRSSPQEGGQQAHREGGVRVNHRIVQHDPAPVSAGPSELSFGVEPSVDQSSCRSHFQQLSESKCKQLVLAADNLLPEAFEALVSHKRLRLLEVACSPDSLLSGTMIELTKDSSAAERCSLFNDCDLRTNQGIHKIIQTIDCRNPELVWLSPICGPYSVMQNINQRSPQQCEELQAKRRDALKQYVGCCIVFSYCVQRGIHVAWEWSQSCQAWRLPIIQKLIQKYEPLFSVVRGCRVGLVDAKGSPISKGWKIMTTHPLLHQRLELPCVCKKGLVHTKCEGSLTRKTELYTKVFAKRVCQAVLQGMDSRSLKDELHGKPQLHDSFGKGTFCVCTIGQQHDAHLQCGSCVHESYQKLVMNPEHDPKTLGVFGSKGCMVAHGGIPEGHPPVERPVEDLVGLLPEKEKIRRQLYLLHAATGHSPIKNMVQALQRRGASPEVILEAKKFECAVCKEKQRAVPRHMASLEPHPPKWSTVAADFGDWVHPHSGHKYQFVLFIDEGSRFRIGRVLLEGSKPHVNASLFLSTLRDAWIQYFGHPQTLRLDPDGTFRSTAVQDFCDRHRIQLDIIPGEAHWKMGVCEQAIGGVKSLMDKLAEDDPNISASDALSEATRAFNNRELLRGYSPIQHALGRAPDEYGRFFKALGPSAGECPDLLVENGTGEMQRNLRRMQVAETSFLEWEAKQRILRAQNSRAQTVREYHPGDLVYIWRKQVSGAAASKHGRFIGPARILAVEQKNHPDGTVQERGSVWCVRGRRLVKCCQEQLRPATSKETLLNELTADPQEDWDFQRVAQELGGNEFEDVSMDVPDLPEWMRAQDPRHEWQPLSRCRIKRSAREAELPHGRAPDGPDLPDLPILDDEPEAPGTGASSRGTRRPHSPGPAEGPTSRRRTEPGSGFVAGTPWYSFAAVVESSSPTPVAFWCQEGAAVSVEVEMPDTKASSERALRDLQAYIANNLKKRSAVEVYEKNLSPSELEEFRSAKAVEVNNFLASKAFQALPDHLRPHQSQAVHMRWVLTWKYRDDGSRKAKARAVLLGYQDPLYENRATTSPTTTRQTRQLQMVLSASLGFSMKKGDVTGAFLQSRPYPRRAFLHTLQRDL